MSGEEPSPDRDRSERERARERLVRDAQRRQAERAGPGATADRLPHAERPRVAPPPRRRVGLLAVLLGVIVLGLLVVGGLALAYFQPGAGPGEGRVTVDIPTGSSASGIGTILEERGVVSSATFFRLRASASGRGAELKPGRYVAREGMSYAAAIDLITAGPSRRVLNVTVPEGRSRRELAPQVRAAGVRGSYLDASVSSPELDPAAYGAKDAEDLEGFLFPDTYELPRGAGARALVKKQLAAFKREWAQVERSGAASEYTPYETLVVASLVEREAQLDRERPLIAGVIYRRLEQREILGIDATTRFATGNFTRPLTKAELDDPSPYNTRYNQGLPPGPIGNPGRESLRAAARPRDTGALYYVVKPGTCGEHAFSKTSAEFNQDVARYDAERARAGGRSPTSCPD
jgi:uncharacterized YceG family protein